MAADEQNSRKIPPQAPPAGPAPAHLSQWDREAWELIRENHPSLTDAEIQDALDRY